MIREAFRRTVLALSICSLLVSPTLSLAATTLPDPLFCNMGATKNTLKADGIDSTRVVVTVRDQNLNAIEGASVTLHSSRGNFDEIIAEKGTTDILGKASFLVRSLKNGNSVITATALNVNLQKSVLLNFENGISFPVEIGDLIKIPDDGNTRTLSDTAVYYYASNGKRYVFSNEKVYFSWYRDFSKVKIIPIDQMSLIPIGGNITYRPGSRLVKFQTDPKTYLVTRGGILRWAKTEAVARGWFGTNWNQYIDDITEAFYVNYTFGQPVENALDLDLEIIRANTISIDQDKGINQPTLP